MEMIQSQNDDRLYRLIQLDNGLKALLVSSINCAEGKESESEEWDSMSGEDSSYDSSDVESEEATSINEEPPPTVTKQSSAALAVHCGSFQDPDYMEGLAHYLEHMLFMGSEKYPVENAYSHFLSKHGGYDNAFTELDATVFHFNVNKQAFPEALDMFANFFINPLLRESSLKAEVEAVESEFQLQVVRDECRIPEVLARQAGPYHPMGKFAAGNRRTLMVQPTDRGLDIREELVEYMEDYYSADKMTLCVQSKHDLDELEQFVRESFSPIVKRETKPFTLPKEIPFFDNPDFFQLFKVVPLHHDISVSLYWPLPPQKHHYREKNLDYLGYAIGQEGINSILYHLRRKHWATELEAGCDEDTFTQNDMYSMFEICLTLTEAGAQNLGEVLRYVHQYINMIRKQGPQEWLWEELKGIAANDFRFEEENKSSDYVVELCVSMKDFPPEHYLCGNTLYFDYNPTRIQSLMDCMTPDKCCVMYINTEFQKEADLFPMKEPYMGVPYKIEDFPDSWKKLWEDDPKFQTRFSLPEPNPFVATNFELLPDPNYANEPYPKNIFKGPRSKLWFYKDDKFHVPKLYVDLHLITRSVHFDVTNVVCFNILSQIYNQAMAPIFNYAEMASLDCDFCGSNAGVTLKFRGFNEKLPLLFERAVTCLVELEFSEEQFQTVVQDLEKTYYNVVHSTSYADEVRNAILRKKSPPFMERWRRIKTIKKKDVSDLHSRMCRSAFIEMYVHGNATAEQALHLINFAEKKLDATPTDEKVYQSCAKIVGSNYIRFLARSPKDENSRIINYYQYKSVHLFENTLFQLLEFLIEEKCFNELRTKQQLGYDISFRMADACKVVGFTVSVSPLASKFSLSHVDEKIDEFMAAMAVMVENLSKEDFETATEALAQVKSCDDLAMIDEHSRNWSQVHYFDYCFEILQLEVPFVKSLKHEQFVKWARKVFNPPEGVRKLSVQLVGYGEKALQDCVGGDEIWKKHLETSKEHQDSKAEMPPIHILLPKDTKGKNFITDFDAFNDSLEYYDDQWLDPRKPVDF